MPRPKGPANVLRCCVCDGAISVVDVLDGEFYPETLVCSQCYSQMQSSDYDISCFGKPTLHPGGLGYDENAEECLMYCPDREVCPVFVEKVVGERLEKN